MRIFTLLIIILFQLSCTAQLDEKDNPIMNDPVDTMQSNYLALGDSYTIGQSVPESERFPVILVNRLNELGYEYNSPRIIAKTGWTTDELDAGIQKENIRDTFDLVSLLIGVNNQYRGKDVEEFRIQFRDLLQQSIDFAGGNKDRVVVISIPDWGVSPFAEGRDREKIAMEIDLFNHVKKEETLYKNIKFVDITAISRSALGNSLYFAEDGLHFSGSMHERWVDEIIRQCF